MELKFRHLGALTDACIDIGDLTLICGRNNTGKTYVAYSIYGLLKLWPALSTWLIDDADTARLADTGSVEIDLGERILAPWQDNLARIATEYRKALAGVLAAEEGRFDATELTIAAPPPGGLVSREFAHTYQRPDATPMVSVTKAHSSMSLVASLVDGDPKAIPQPVLRDMLLPAVQSLAFSGVVPRVVMISTERTGAATFRNELNFTRTRLIEALSSVETSKRLEPKQLLSILIPEFSPRYPLPVRDEVDRMNQVDAVQGSQGELITAMPELLTGFEELLGGRYHVSRGSVYFQPAGRSPKLALNESSSSVRSLLGLGLYLRHQARTGDLLMIDEPELNLHPASQVLMARLLARLVNAGLKVLVTTHSDYIAKELNTMLLLGSTEVEVAERLGYKSDERLDAGRARVYVAGEQSVKRNAEAKRRSRHLVLSAVQPLPDASFEFLSFDETINEMNARQDQILDHLDDAAD
jgi:hypothetical protein